MASWVMGIDPGALGAIALYDRDTERLGAVWDMPSFMQTIGRSAKRRIDAPALAAILETSKDLGVELCVLEAVGGLPKQSSPNAFTFGWSCGIVYMGLIQNRIAVDPVRPAVWKKILRCGKEDHDILARAKELFPGRDSDWVGPKGGVRDGRAEAAMLALFAAHHAYGKTESGAERRILTA